MPDGDLQNICRGRQAVDNHPLMKNYKAAITRRPSRYRPAEIEQAMRAEPDVVLGDILQRTGGVYETTPRLTPKFREDIREIAEGGIGRPAPQDRGASRSTAGPHC